MQKNSQEIITNTVAQERAKRSLSQIELATKVGVSKQTIYLIERGNYMPSLLLAYRLANLFNMNVTTLFTYERNFNK